MHATCWHGAARLCNDSISGLCRPSNSGWQAFLSACRSGSGRHMNLATEGEADRSEPVCEYRVRTLSVASPAYNEAEGIERVVRQWLEYLRGIPQLEHFEIVVCNDGSRDDTGSILDRVAAEMPELRPIHSPRNRGAGAATRAGHPPYHLRLGAGSRLRRPVSDRESFSHDCGCRVTSGTLRDGGSCQERPLVCSLWELEQQRGGQPAARDALS